MGWARVGVTTLSSSQLGATPYTQWSTIPYDDSFWNCREYSAQIMKEAASAGMRLNLFFFLSDTAAYASRQTAPAAWQGLSVSDTAAAVQSYCYATTQYFIDQGLNIEVYDIGNEIQFGILDFTPGDRISVPPGTDLLNDTAYLESQLWPTEATLLQAAITGVKMANPNAKITLHITGLGASQGDQLIKTFFSTMIALGVDFDYAGLSFPARSGHPAARPYFTSPDFISTVKYLQSLNKQVLIDEFYYPNGPVDAQGTPDPGYAFTPAGQAAYVRDMRASCIDQGIARIFYFYPDYFPGDSGTNLDDSGLMASQSTVQPASLEFGTTQVAADLPTSPSDQNATLGLSATFTAGACGLPAPAYSWQRKPSGTSTWSNLTDGGNYSGSSTDSLMVSNTTLAMTGDRFRAFASNGIGAAAPSDAATLTVGQGPSISQQPLSQYVSLGSSAMFEVAAAASSGTLSYAWKKNGVVVGTGPYLVIGSVQATDMGFYSVTVSDAAASVSSAIAILTVDSASSSRLINVSTRGFVPAGGSMTPGFVLQGSGTKALVVRAVGPTLASFGVADVLPTPRLSLVGQGSATPVLTNDGWETSADVPSLVASMSAVGAFPLLSGSLDSAANATLDCSGNSPFTVVITGSKATDSGIVLGEVYDGDPDPLAAPVKLLNVSTLSFTGTGADTLTSGFVVSGAQPKLLLIRAVGPGLAPFAVGGLLGDPEIAVIPQGASYSAKSNDDWCGTSLISAAMASAGAFSLPGDSTDAAIVVRLPPGGYTIQATGLGNATGNVLLEVYDLDP